MIGSLKGGKRKVYIKCDDQDKPKAGTENSQKPKLPKNQQNAEIKCHYRREIHLAGI